MTSKWIGWSRVSGMAAARCAVLAAIRDWWLALLPPAGAPLDPSETQTSISRATVLPRFEQASARCSCVSGIIIPAYSSPNLAGRRHGLESAADTSPRCRGGTTAPSRHTKMFFPRLIAPKTRSGRHRHTIKDQQRSTFLQPPRYRADVQGSAKSLRLSYH